MQKEYVPNWHLSAINYVQLSPQIPFERFRRHGLHDFVDTSGAFAAGPQTRRSLCWNSSIEGSLESVYYSEEV